MNFGCASSDEFADAELAATGFALRPMLLASARSFLPFKLSSWLQGGPFSGR